MSEQYQRGSVRKLKRASGKQIWEWRYRLKGVMKQESFDAADFPNQKGLWVYLETRLALLNDGSNQPIPQAPTMRVLLDKYIGKHLPELAKSTRDTDGSMLRVHFYHRWETTLIADVHAEDVEDWIKTLKCKDGKPLSPASKGRARRLMKQMIDRAMFWRMLPMRENPMKLIRVKGVTKREKPIVLVTISQVNRLVAALPQPYNLMVLVAASLGLRVEEVLPLKWVDFNFAQRTLTITRAYTHGELKEVKTNASGAVLPIEGALVDAILTHQTHSTSEWCFPSPKTTQAHQADGSLARLAKVGLALTSTQLQVMARINNRDPGSTQRHDAPC
jgi:integrase